MKEKERLRKLARQSRDDIPRHQQERWSGEIQQKVRNSPWYKEAGILLSYASFRSEVNTDQINQWALEDGKELYLPKTYTERHQMVYYRVRDLSLLIAGYMGIREPQEVDPWEPAAYSAEIPVLMLMPALLYDGKGNRLGYGGGYYDRYLGCYGDRISHTVMLVFHIQQIPEIKTEKWDIPPDGIITDGGEREV